jgi:hypothetical protein
MKAKFVIPFLMLFLFQGCMLFRGIIVEEDVVQSSKRVRANFEYRNARERYSPLVSVVQTIVKEAKTNAPSQIKIYDRIRLNINSFKLDDKVYLIIDKAPYPGKLEKIEFERETKFEEKRKDVLTADSTKVSVVTGYNNNENNVYKLTYTIDEQVVEKIKHCNSLQFRYYAGPDMITTNMSHFELETLKLLLERN